MDKLFAMLGLARRAGKLAIGRDAVISGVRTKKARLILLTQDASPRHRQELEAIGCKARIVVIPCGMDVAAEKLGKRSCVFAVEDENFGAAIEKLI